MYLNSYYISGHNVFDYLTDDLVHIRSFILKIESVTNYYKEELIFIYLSDDCILFKKDFNILTQLENFRFVSNTNGELKIVFLKKGI